MDDARFGTVDGRRLARRECQKPGAGWCLTTGAGVT